MSALPRFPLRPRGTLKFYFTLRLPLSIWTRYIPLGTVGGKKRAYETDEIREQVSRTVVSLLEDKGDLKEAVAELFEVLREKELLESVVNDLMPRLKEGGKDFKWLLERNSAQ